MTRPGTRLGVDVGSVRVGVAVSDPDALLATPLRTVRAGEDDDVVVAEVARLVAEHGVVEVVVGLPRTLAGGEGTAAQAARKYARALAVRIAPVPVRLHDERLTTVDAHRGLRDSGVDTRRHRAVVDQAAAVLILQSALDAERSSGQPPGELVRADGRKPRTKGRSR